MKKKAESVVFLPRSPVWVCENVFCNMRDICSAWGNCKDCETRTKFLNYALSDKRPAQTVWGKTLRGRLESFQKAYDKWMADGWHMDVRLR